MARKGKRLRVGQIVLRDGRRRRVIWRSIEGGYFLIAGEGYRSVEWVKPSQVRPVQRSKRRKLGK